MPPKKAPPPVSQKQKQKIVEDKTFGLKNKNKSKKVNEYVQAVQKQVNNPTGRRKEEDPKLKAQKKKEEEEARKAELALLYKPIQAQKAPPGVDPKSLLCEFFKAGTCTKGAKCKFSHDLAIERKAAKIDIYTDARDEEKKEDTMDKWDQAKLEQVVTTKSGGMKPKSDIICKYFLDALEKNQYGWFWECPNGDTCHYRHALPPGFVLKRDVKKKKDEDDETTLEEYIEHERGKITGPLTPVTEASFAEWKKKRIEKKKLEEDEKKKAKEAAIKAGKALSLSGRDLFTYRPDLFVDDDEAGDDDLYQNREASDGEESDEPQKYGMVDASEESDTEEDYTNGGEGSSKSREVGALEEDVFVTEDLDNLDLEDEEDGDGEEEEGEDGDGEGEDGDGEADEDPK